MSHLQPRLLQLIAPAPFGGAESVCRALARAYPGSATLAVLLQSGGSHPFVEQALAEGSDIRVLTGGRRRYDREVDLVAALLEEIRPAVLHTHIYHADFVGWFAARRSGLPIVAHVHGITGGDWKDRLYQWFDLRLLRGFDALICVSESVRKRLVDAGCRADRTHVVPNPYAGPQTLPRADARRALGIEPGRPVIGWIGRLSIEKGADLLLRTLQCLPEPRPLTVVIGDGPEMPALRALTEELGLRADVHFAGELAGAATLLTAFDALVISSRSEGLPMTLLEAMGAGTPVVAFAIGGIPDALDESTGRLAPPLDVSMLAARIAEALADEAGSGQRAAEAARRVRERYGIGPWVAAISEVHATAIAGRGRRP